MNNFGSNMSSNFYSNKSVDQTIHVSLTCENLSFTEPFKVFVKIKVGHVDINVRAGFIKIRGTEEIVIPETEVVELRNYNRSSGSRNSECDEYLSQNKISKTISESKYGSTSSIASKPLILKNNQKNCDKQYSASCNTFEAEYNFTDAQVLQAGGNYEWELSIELPLEVPPIFEGKYSNHSYYIQAGLDCLKEDVCSEWVELFQPLF